jgi:hypothetical protein
MRKLDHDWQGAPTPTVEIPLIPRILVNEQLSRSCIFFGSGLQDPGIAMLDNLSQLDRDRRICLYVADPVAAISTASQHEDPTMLGGEPDLDPMRPTGLPPHGGQIAERFFSGVFEPVRAVNRVRHVSTLMLPSAGIAERSSVDASGLISFAQ